MRLVRTSASTNSTDTKKIKLVLSKKDWQNIGIKAGWIKEAKVNFQEGYVYKTLKGPAKVITLNFMKDGLILFEYTDGPYAGKQFTATSDEASNVHETLGDMDVENQMKTIDEKNNGNANNGNANKGNVQKPNKLLNFLDNLLSPFVK